VTQDRWHNSEVNRQGKIVLLQKGVPQTKSLVSKHTGWEVHSGFISNACLHLTLIESVSCHNLHDVKMGDMGQVAFEQGGQRFT
jgi:hypothetical protein